MLFLRKPRLVFTLLWVMLCSAILWWFVSHPKAWSDPEITVLYILIMLMITFPLGAVYWAALSMFAVIVPEPGLGRETEFALIWFGFVAVGYFQWAMLAPWGYRKLREVVQKRRIRIKKGVSSQ